MKIEFNLVKNILNTLPIGYYLGRSINVKLSHESSSYFNSVEDLIVIGFQSIEDAVNSINTNTYKINDVEEIIRGLLYHELSHVILTPHTMFVNNLRYKEVLNIFEDERIETIFKDFYMNVNFKKNIILINNYKGELPQDGRQAFYHLVRFHQGKPEFLNRVSYILKKYHYINASTEQYDNNQTGYNYYVNDVIELYKAVVKDWDMTHDSNTNDNQSQNNNSSNKSDKSSEQNNSNSEQNNSNVESNETEQNNSNSNTNENNKETNKENSSSNNNQSASSDDSDTKESLAGNNESDDLNNSTDSNELTEDDIRNLISSIIDNDMISEKIAKDIQHAIAVTVNNYYDPQLSLRLEKIIEMKLKKQKQNGSAINSYSGRLNVKAIGQRDDYKWWVQQNREGHVRQYSKVHFNLFLDNSGSFQSNDIMMNRFIQSLIKICNKDFDFDIITINTRIREWSSPTDKLFMSNGGTRLSNEIQEVIKRHTKPYTQNYNIVLFDGDADPDTYRDSNAFKHFDSPNTIIVTDQQNKRYIQQACKNARTFITTKYCDEFIGVVCDLLERTMI